jgi:hypothetical protein
MSNVVFDLFFWWLPVIFLLIQWLFFLSVLALAIYTLILRRRLEHEEDQSWAANVKLNDCAPMTEQRSFRTLSTVGQQ